MASSSRKASRRPSSRGRAPSAPSASCGNSPRRRRSRRIEARGAEKQRRSTRSTDCREVIMAKRRIGAGIAAALIGVIVGTALGSAAARADSPGIAQLVAESHLTKVTKSGVLRVCQYPQYYSISFRNPPTNQLEGIDADLSKELAKDLGVKLEVVESSFVTFIADL